MQDINTFTPPQLAESLLNASKNGDVDFIKEFFNSDWVIGNNLLKFDKFSTSMMENCCSYGQVEIAKILMESEFEKFLNNPHKIQDYVTKASENGHLEVIKYLVNTPTVKIGSNFTTPFWGAMRAAEHGQLNVLKYLLNPTKDYLINSPNSEGKILEAACRKDNIPVLQYLITLPKYNLQQNLEKGFETALRSSTIENLKYFIFDLNIEKNKDVSYIMGKNYVSHSVKLEVEKMFDARDLKKSLQTELPALENKTKKIKV